MTATLTPSAPSASPPLARRAGRDRGTVGFRIAIALIALHVVDDNYLQPQPGTTPGDHVVSGLVPLALLGLAGWAYPRLRGGWRGALALALGVLGIAAGIEAFHYTRASGPTGDDFSGLLAIPAGLALLGLGAATLWRSRRTDGSRWRRYLRRALLGVAGVFGALIVGMIGLGYVTTHVARAVVPANTLGVPYEDVTFTTSDGLELDGWYVPSRNGAAVMAIPGRGGAQKQARMLARHGYGVLLFDRRGEGTSEGDPNSWGWGGSKDIKAAIDFLQRRPDVKSGRIGGIGLSVGGEILLETASETDELAAVVAEGAGARSTSEDLDQDLPGYQKLIAAPVTMTKTLSIAVFSNHPIPTNLKHLVGKIAPRPVLLIAAPNSGYGEDLNRGFYTAAGQPKTLWEIPESNHVGGLKARPREYEQRVIQFFDNALLP